MKKIIILMAILLFLAGCAAPQTQEATQQETVTEQVNSVETISGEIADNIAEVLDLGQEARCVATIEGKEAVFWIKDGQERIEAETEQGKTISLFLGDQLYSWVEDQEQGVMIDFAKLKEMQQDEEHSERAMMGEINTAQEFNEKANDIECEEIKISDDLFKIPENVEFMDLADLISGFGQ